MFIRTSRWLYRLSKGKTVVLLIVGFFLFTSLTLYLLPLIIPASKDMVSLDDAVFYKPHQVFSIIDDWGDDGRTLQLWFHMTWDVIVPLWSFLIVGTSTSWILKRAFAGHSKWRKLNLVAWVVVFDLLENFSLAALILIYPMQPVWLAWLKTAFTMIKYASGVLMVGVLLIGLVQALKNRIERISIQNT